MPRITVGTGVELFYTDDGSTGVPVLLVHGWTCDSHDWIWQIGPMSRTHRVVAPDLRGHGHSDPAGAYGLSSYAEDLADLIDILNLGPVVAVGHSFGGAVISRLATLRPELVAALVVVDPAYGAAIESMPIGDVIGELRSERCQDLITANFVALSSPTTPQHLLCWYLRRAASLAREVVSETIAGLVNEQGRPGPSRAELSTRYCPILSLHRTEEAAEWDRATFAHPASRALVWTGNGHWLHQERPEEFNLVVESWLNAALPASHTVGSH